MARQDDQRQGSWLLLDELLDRGDEGFVDELRRIHDADRLGAFAARWYDDQRPAARSLMFAYLARPLNAFRHEALVKRLYKLAEQAGDDELMGHFLAAFDRGIRRYRHTVTRFDWRTRESWTEEHIRIRTRLAMPRKPQDLRFRDPVTHERLAAPSREKQDRLRLFSQHTRHYLRRRAWRYFRTLGKANPSRYVSAVAAALANYVDADAHDGLALLDCYGLMHVMFGKSPVLKGAATGWNLAAGRTLTELEPAPVFAVLWQADAASLIKLLSAARCRPVRQWALRMLRAHHAAALAQLPLKELLAMLRCEDGEIAALAAKHLARSAAAASLSVAEWRAILEEANPHALDALCDQLESTLPSDQVSFAQALEFAQCRPVPVARLGLKWLSVKQPASADECCALLALAESAAEAIRADAVRWLRGVLSAAPWFDAGWVLDLLDARFPDVRREAWAWFLVEPRAHQQVDLWQKLLESPYDDIRLELVRFLENRAHRDESVLVERGKLNPARVRQLWAAVLLNVHRGNRAKRRVIGQLTERLTTHPNEADTLLPLLSVALRSLRGPEWRAALAGVVTAVHAAPDLAARVQAAFPDLNLGELVA